MNETDKSKIQKIEDQLANDNLDPELRVFLNRYLEKLLNRVDKSQERNYNLIMNSIQKETRNELEALASEAK